MDVGGVRPGEGARLSGRLRILCVEPKRYDEELRAKLASFADVDYVDVSDGAELVAAAGRAPYDAFLVRLGLRIDAGVLDAAKALRVVATPTTGIDHIDVGACERRGVRVVSLKGETAFLDSIRSTAEHTWAMLLALCRHLPAAHQEVLEGRWQREPFLADELAGKTLGIVGCGRLGRMVAGYGVAFGMRVLVNDIREDAYERAPAGSESAPLDALLAQSDVVSVHLPLEDGTRGLFGAQRIALMRRGAMLVNTARGEIVDEDALAAAIRARHLGGAAVDVLAGDATWSERVEGAHPLLDLARGGARVIVTPHIGGYGSSSIGRTREFIADKLRRAWEAA